MAKVLNYVQSVYGTLSRYTLEFQQEHLSSAIDARRLKNQIPTEQWEQITAAERAVCADMYFLPATAAARTVPTLSAARQPPPQFIILI